VEEDDRRPIAAAGFGKADRPSVIQDHLRHDPILAFCLVAR
jgi:hypothetical protein